MDIKTEIWDEGFGRIEEIINHYSGQNTGKHFMYYLYDELDQHWTDIRHKLVETIIYEKNKWGRWEL